jgi:hypothetical protein
MNKPSKEDSIVIDYMKANYRLVGWRLLYVCRWALFLLWSYSFWFILFIGPASNNWFGGLFWEQLAGWAGPVVGIAIAQWVLVGYVRLKILLPWTKLDGLAKATEQ